jgi:ubiquinol-cytochrome c reductase cytochrome c subunit
MPPQTTTSQPASPAAGRPRRTGPHGGRPRPRARRARPGWLLVAVVAGCGLLQLGIGGRSATAAQPAQAAGRGRELYQQSCATCHGQHGEGTERGPSLVGVGAASADFYLSTGRMPITQEERSPARRRPAFGQADVDALVAYVASLGGGPAVPRVDPAAGRLAEGERLYQENCAACHSATGTGGALTSGQVAPSLGPSTPVQVAEAIRVGPGAMPTFDQDALDDRQVDSIAGYVGRLQRGGNPGGLDLGRVGPVTEGLVAWVLGLGLLVLVARRLGKDAP